MFIYDQITEFPRAISFVRRHFQLKSFQVINPKMIPMKIVQNIEERFRDYREGFWRD